MVLNPNKTRQALIRIGLKHPKGLKKNELVSTLGETELDKDLLSDLIFELYDEALPKRADGQPDRVQTEQYRLLQRAFNPTLKLKKSVRLNATMSPDHKGFNWPMVGAFIGFGILISGWIFYIWPDSDNWTSEDSHVETNQVEASSIDSVEIDDELNDEKEQ